MSTKFTEGPWKAHNRGPVFTKEDVYEIHWSEDGECVAEIVHGEADANLIAAAPELYEALKEMEEFVDMECGIGAFSSSCKSAVKALAKARGEG